MAIGAYGIINRLLTLYVMIVLGLTMGMQPIVGYNFGAQKIDRVKVRHCDWGLSPGSIAKWVYYS